PISPPDHAPPPLHYALPILQPAVRHTLSRPAPFNCFWAPPIAGCQYLHSARTSHLSSLFGCWLMWSPSEAAAQYTSIYSAAGSLDRKSTRLNSSHVSISYAL